MNICCEIYFKLSQDEYLEIKKIMDNNIDIIELLSQKKSYMYFSSK